MFAVALVLRIAIAPHVGFFGDLRLFQVWSMGLRAVGTHGLYATDSTVDYPPGYLVVLWVVGKLSASPGYLLLKLPAIISDLVLAWLAGTFAARIAPVETTQRTPVRALVAAAVLFNPAVFGLSAGWGQVDAIPVCFMMASLLLLLTGDQTFRREAAAAVLFGFAFSIKPQTCLAFPVIGYALYERYFHHKPRAEIMRGVYRVALLGAFSITVWALLGIPFGLGPAGLFKLYQRASSLYSVTSANAFNFWGILGFWRPDSSGTNVMKVLGVPAAKFGLLVFVVGAAYMVWRVHRAIERGADPGRVLLLAAAVLSLLGYTFLTRMHERYSFLALASFAPLVFSKPIRRMYVALSGLFLLNLWYPYAVFNTQWRVQAFVFQPWFDWLEGGFAADPWQKKVLSLAFTIIAVVAAWRGVRWVEESVPSSQRTRRTLTSMNLAGLLHSSPAPAPSDGTIEPVLARGFARWVPLSLVGVSSLFGLVILRGETKYAENLNDSALHLLMVRWASGQLHEGRLPLDGWFPYFSIGSSFFHHYQSLPHILTALLSNIAGISNATVYLWILYLLLALWPISVYVSARLLDWSKWTAACAALISPLIVSAPGYGYEHGSYTWQGFGVYSQEWGMWLLPLAWGLTWRAVSRGRHYAAAAVAIALTIACHFITGYLALLTIGVWVIVAGKSGFVRRFYLAAIVAGGSLLVAAWVVVPLVSDMKYSARTEYYQGGIFNDSYGASKVLGWLFKGELFDLGRFPVVTLLFAGGAIVCIVRARHDARARALLGAFVLSLLLFFGRPTLGPVLDLLPGFRDVQIHRFVMGVDLAAILLAGVGLAWLSRKLRLLVAQYTSGSVAVASAISILLCVGLLTPAWRERIRYANRGEALMASQISSDSTDGRALDRLIEIVRQRHDGRVYAGMRANWGQQYRVGSVPVHAWLANRQIDAIGFVFRTITSLSTDIEAAFDENNLAQYQMLNVRYVIVPAERSPTVPAKLIMESGRHRLYEVNTSGYFQVVDRAAAVSADRTNIQRATLEFRNSPLALVGIYPGLAFAGASALPATFSGASPPSGSPGNVLAQTNTLQDGLFDAAVEANRPAVVLLKATYDPRWSTTVDGRAVKPTMMAPSLVGVEVPSGIHNVTFRYKPYAGYPLLLAIGALALLALILVPRRSAWQSPVSSAPINPQPKEITSPEL